MTILVDVAIFILAMLVFAWLVEGIKDWMR